MLEMENYSTWCKYQNEVAMYLLRWDAGFAERIWAALCADLAPFLSGTNPKASDPITAALLLRKQVPTALADVAAKFNISEKQIWALLIDRAEPTTTSLERLSDARDQILRLTVQQDFSAQQKLHATFNYGAAERQRQSARAQHPRIKVDVDSDQLTPSEIISELAHAAQYEDYTARELWPVFLGEMAANHFEPEEDDSDPKATKCEYWLVDRPKTLSFRHFANEIARHRKKIRLAGLL
jgi:transcriptional regulator with XRE-family HTH domain